MDGVYADFCIFRLNGGRLTSAKMKKTIEIMPAWSQYGVSYG